MNRLFKLMTVLCVALVIGMTISSCSNPYLSTNAGVNVRFGPNGPYVDPYVNVGVHSSSGRRY